MMRHDLIGYDEDETADAGSVMRAHKPSHAELRTMVVATAVLLYAIVTQDLPVCFLVSGFLLYETRYYIEQYGGPHGQMLSGIMKGLSLTLSLGALLMVIF